MGFWIFSTIIAYFVKGVIGFANTVVFTSLMTFSTDNINITPIELLLSIPAHVVLVWKERRSIDWKLSLPLIGFLFAGSIPGIFLLKNMNTSAVKVIFGFLTIGIAIQMYMTQRSTGPKKISKAYLTIIGIASGVFCGMFGIGALLGAYLGNVTDDPRKIKANISLVFLAETLMRFCFYVPLGIINRAAITRAAILFPFMLLGIFLGFKASSHISDKKVKLLMIVLLILSGVSLIVNNLSM